MRGTDASPVMERCDYVCGTEYTLTPSTSSSDTVDDLRRVQGPAA